ncbi:MAG: MmgE/PrpD family protein [Gammaproteobacteria bacterium]|nr:MmgE/PrpD family protein [Gammaproteobacteria bacterium]
MSKPLQAESADAPRVQAGISTTIAEFAHTLRYDAIPSAVRERARHLILDACGIALAASREPYAASFLAGLQTLGESGQSSIIGLAARLTIRDAAIMNGALVHGLDFDDTHMQAVVHATAVSLPCALVIAEKQGCSGRELLTAYLIGMEVAIRLGAAANFGFHHRGLHATGIVGHFSSAVVAARLLGLDVAGIRTAQGIAGSTAMASQQFVDDGAWNKRLHPGWGAAAGITAAALAKGGFIAPTLPYEGRFGLYRNLCDDAESLDLSAITEGLGERWTATESAVKPFPTCHFTHGVADAALELRKQHRIDPASITRVRALIPAQTIPVIAEPAAAKIRPGSDYDAKFSTQYIVAACLLRGRFGLAELAPEVLNDAEILALANKVVCEVDPDADFPRYYSGALIVTTDDGREYLHRERINRGAPERAVSDAEIVEKFKANARRAVSPAAADRICESVLEMEEMDGVTLMSRLRG